MLLLLRASRFGVSISTEAKHSGVSGGSRDSFPVDRFGVISTTDLERRDIAASLAGVLTAGEYTEKPLSSSAVLAADEVAAAVLTVSYLIAAVVRANGFGGVLVISGLRLNVGVNREPIVVLNPAFVSSHVIFILQPLL